MWMITHKCYWTGSKIRQYHRLTSVNDESYMAYFTARGYIWEEIENDEDFYRYSKCRRYKESQ